MANTNSELKARIRELEEALDIREAEAQRLRTALQPFVKAGKCLDIYDVRYDSAIRQLTGTQHCSPLFSLRPSDFVQAIEAAEGVFTPNKMVRYW